MLANLSNFTDCHLSNNKNNPSERCLPLGIYKATQMELPSFTIHSPCGNAIRERLFSLLSGQFLTGECWTISKDLCLPCSVLL
jgi:hypothetical protein